MLNEQLRNVYSESVCDSLKDVANFFEERNIVAYAYGLKGEDVNIKAPIAILFDNRSVREEASYAVYDCYNKYAGSLSPECDEKLGGLTCSYAKELWVDHLDEKESLSELWVK